MQGVSAIIAIILILIIVVAIASLFWIFMSGLFTGITETSETSITQITEALSSCMKIDSVFHNKIYLRNCGTGTINNDTLNIYIDDSEFEFSMNPESIDKGEVATITLPIWGISIGDHTLKITNPKIELVKNVKSVLHDSCILALDFDEGSGTTANDKSRYENDGTLHNGTEICSDGYCPRWVVGKYRKALEFDGLGDYIIVYDSDSLDITSDISIEAWVKFNMISPDWHGIVTKWNAGGSLQRSYGLWHSENKIEFTLSENGGWVPDTIRLVSVFDPVADVWYHIVGSYNRTIMMLYINGNLDNNIAGPPSINLENANLTVSCSYESDEPAQFLNATIDSVRIYNKTLTPDETVILKLK